MRKFSSICESREKKEKELSLKEELTYNLLYLMEQFLSIETKGSIDRYYRAGFFELKGKELLAEAIVDLIENYKKDGLILENFTKEFSKKKGGEQVLILENITLKTFEDLAKECSDHEEFIDKVRKIKGVPSEVASQFFDEYGDGGGLDITSAAKNFFEKHKK